MSTDLEGVDATPGWPRLIVYFVALPDPIPIEHGSTFLFQTGPEIPDWAGLTQQSTEGSGQIPGPITQSVSIRFWQVRFDPDAGNQSKAVNIVLDQILPNRDEGKVFSQDWQVWRPDKEVLRRVVNLVGRNLQDHFHGEVDIDKMWEEGPINYRTVVELVTVVRRDPNEETDPIEADSFSRCLMCLDDLLRAYRIANSSELHRISYQQCPTLVPFLWRDPAGVDGGVLGGVNYLMLAHGNVSGAGIAPRPVDASSHARMMHCVSRLRNRDPLMLTLEKLADARTAYQRLGDLSTATIYSAMAAEILLDGVLALLLWEEALAFSQYDPPIGEGVTVIGRDLRSRVKSAFHPRLGGQWSLTGNGPLGRWARDVAFLRGRIVHRGYFPTSSESEYANRIVIDLMDFIKDRISDARERYPRTALLVLGQPGLERRDAWDASIARLLSGDGHEFVEWLQNYGDWRDRVDLAIWTN